MGKPTVSAVLIAASFLMSLAAYEIGLHAINRSTLTNWMYSKENEDFCKAKAEELGTKCPNLSFQYYFLKTAYTSIYLTAAFIIAKLLRPNEEVTLWCAIYNLGISVALFAGGILLIVSANQIHTLYKDGFDHEYSSLPRPEVIPKNYRQDYDEKICAGAISIIGGVLYAASGFLGFMAIKTESK